MAVPTYDHIQDAEIEPEAPITASVMGRLRDNPYAIIREDILTTPGAGTVDKPAYANRLHVMMWGGGGGGGTFSAGGGGGCFVHWFEGDTFDDLPSTIAYVVGAAGAYGSPLGTAGGNSTFNGDMVAAGGGAGSGSSSNGGAGGTLLWAGILVPGTNAGTGGVFSGSVPAGGSIYGGGGGGQSGGSSSGGSSIYGGGGGAEGGTAGSSKYGGAGGAQSNPGTAPAGGGGARSGGDGARGEIRLRWYP